MRNDAADCRITLRDLGGKVLRLFEVDDGVWTEEQDWVVRGGALLATFEGGVEKHYHLVHLGTPRLVTSDVGVWLRANDPEPFGADPLWRLPQDTARMQLTGHERDQSSGLDYLHARYYNPNVARFLSVDPGPPSARVPQSWNRYAYVLNNPINATDPDGQLPEWLKKLWGWVTGQEAQNAVNQAVDDATKASTERSEQERQQDAELLQVAGLHASNAGAVLGTGGAKFAEGARQGVKDLAGPVAREVTGAVVAAGVVKVIRVGGVLLNEAQAANLARFQQKLPRGAGAVTIQEFGNGARAFVSEVPGRVPGSRAAYIKEVGASGETTRYVKVTFAPDGSVVSVKQKY